MKKNDFVKLVFIGATIFATLLSSCDNTSKNKAKTDSLAIKPVENTEKIAEKNDTEKVENTSSGVEIDVTFLRATWYAGSTKYYFKNAKGEEIEISLLNDPTEAKDYNPKMPKESLLEDDDPKREGPPSENPKFVGKKFKIVYDAKDKGKVVEIKKDL